jgi:hypothetical protein
MNRDELLKKIREENEQNDPFETDTSRLGWKIGAWVALAIAFVVFLLELIIFGDYNFSVFIVATSMIAVNATVRAVKLKGKLDIVAAIVVSFVFLVAAVFYALAFCWGMV